MPTVTVSRTLYCQTCGKAHETESSCRFCGATSRPLPAQSMYALAA